MAPFSVYAENEEGYKSQQAKVILNIIPNSNWALKFKRNVIKIDNNLSIGTVIGNVLERESKRKLFLLDMYVGETSCGLGNFSTYYNKSPQSLSQICTKSKYFNLEDNGNIMITQMPDDGNYSFNIFAVDRFGVKELENQKIEVIKP